MKNRYDLLQQESTDRTPLRRIFISLSGTTALGIDTLEEVILDGLIPSLKKHGIHLEELTRRNYSHLKDTPLIESTISLRISLKNFPTPEEM